MISPRRATLPVLVLVLVLVLAVAGCGGGTSASDYREEATGICETATRDAAAVAAPDDSAESVAAYSSAVAEIRQRETVALDELEPPDDLRADHTLLVNASGAIVRSLLDLAAAAERGDRDAATAAAGAGSRAADQARRAADGLDLPACGQPGQPRP